MERFRGADLVAFLNGKLEDYGWLSLDARSPFDAALRTLETLTLEMDPEGELLEGSLGGRGISEIRKLQVPNVPAPLGVIHAIFHALAAWRQEMPLPCDLYELL